MKYVVVVLLIVLTVVLTQVFTAAPNPTALGITGVMVEWLGFASAPLLIGLVGMTHKRNPFLGFTIVASLTTLFLILGSMPESAS